MNKKSDYNLDYSKVIHLDPMNTEVYIYRVLYF